MLQGFAMLLVFQLIGEIIVQWVKVPLPGPLVGALLIFAFSIVRGGMPEPVREAGGALLQHLPLLFLPAVVGVMQYGERIASEWLPFLLTGIGATAITMAVTALTLRWLLERSGEHAE